MKVLGEQGPVAVREPHESTAVVRVGAALDEVHDPIVNGVHVFAPDLAAQIDAAVSVAAFHGAISGPHGAEDP